MFVVSLTYKVPLEQIEPHMEAHIDWLKNGYAEGHVVASGRKNPRTGGVILAKGTRELVESFCHKDPFVAHDLVDLDITEVNFSMAAEGFDVLKEV